ncbi:MAG: chromate transporter [Roseiflexaceae bacterium]
MAHTWWQLFRIWAGIGLQSFGGGATTLYLMRKVSVEEQQWLSDEEYSQYWGIVQIAPGINLLGQTILIGNRVAGIWGAIIALAGLLLPSVAITIAITAAYTVVRELPAVNAVLRGIIPATVGVGLLLAAQMVWPPLRSSRSEGIGPLVLSLLLIIAVIGVTLITKLPSLVILWGGAGIYALIYWLFQRNKEPS